MLDIHAHLVTRDNSEVEKLIEDMKENNIEKRIVSTLSPNPTIDNIQFIEEVVKNHADKLIGCAVINPKLTTAVDDVKYAINSNEIAMIEFNSFEHAYYPDQLDNLHEIFRLIERKSLPVKIFTGIGCFAIPQQWEKYVKEFKNIKFIFLHMGCFDYGYACIDVVARNENAYVEISNQYELQIIRKALNNLSNEKILFGTTFPERLTSSSLLLFDMLDVSESLKQKIFYTNNYDLIQEVI